MLDKVVMLYPFVNAPTGLMASHFSQNAETSLTQSLAMNQMATKGLVLRFVLDRDGHF